VMSTHGRGGIGRFLYGSVADDVLRHARVPVVLLPAAAPAAWPTAGKLRVLVPLDGSDLAVRALEPVLALARRMPIEVVLAQVVPMPGAAAAQLGFPPTYALPPLPDPNEQLAAARAHLEDRAARLAGAVAVTGLRAEIGAPAATLVELASAEGVHLIAMSTHGRGGLTRAVMGSVASGVVRHATVPLLLIPAAARAASLAPVAALPPGRPAAGPVTVTLRPNELSLVLYGLEMLLHAAERDQALTEPVRRLIDELTRAGAPAVPTAAAAS
jgi:nucleotide-binding universal stress UspA family protein